MRHVFVTGKDVKIDYGPDITLSVAVMQHPKAKALDGITFCCD